VPVAGNIVREIWLYLDAAGAPKGSMASPGDVTLGLFRSTSGGAFVAASETVTWAAVGGQTGYYDISYTPESGALYRLYLNETNADSLFRRWSFTHEVLAAGAAFTPSLANAFCSEADVERWTQLAFDTTSKPTSAEVAAFCQSRASEIRALVAAEGWIIAPSTVVPGPIEEDMLRECNAVGAAADSYLAKFVDVDPSQTAHAVALQQEYERRLERLIAYAEKIAGGDFIRSPMTSGEVTLKDETTITDAGLAVAIRMDQDF
jgi:hypothetical protein